MNIHHWVRHDLCLNIIQRTVRQKHIRISALYGNGSNSRTHNIQRWQREEEWFGDSSSGEERESIPGQEFSKSSLLVEFEN